MVADGARTDAVVAYRWTSVSADAPTDRALDADYLEVGGDPDARIHLAFPRPHGSSPIASATLVLHPTASEQGPASEVLLVVERTGELERGARSYASVPAASGSAIAEVFVPARRSALVRFDVTDAAVDAEDDHEPLSVRVRVSQGDAEAPLRFASPRDPDPRRHPRLEIAFQ